jgi:hypothetical protein
MPIVSGRVETPTSQSDCRGIHSAPIASGEGARAHPDHEMLDVEQQAAAKSADEASVTAAFDNGVASQQAREHSGSLTAPSRIKARDGATPARLHSSALNPPTPVLAGSV